MIASTAAFALLLLVVSVLIAGSWAWLFALLRLALGASWMPQPAASGIRQALESLGVSPDLPLVLFAPRRPVPWALFDLIAIVAMWLIGSAMGSVALRQLGWLKAVQDVADLSLREQQTLIAANSITSLIIVAIGMPLIAARTGARLADFGWLPTHVLADLRLGLIGFVMLAPPVFALQALLVLLWQPSKHPLIEMFQASPDPRLFGLLLISAAAVAPLFEEILFRVLLQGFLEKIVDFTGEVHELFFGDVRRSEAESELQLTSDAPLKSPDFQPPAPQLPASDVQPPLYGLRAWLPIAASSIVFALMHYSHGPDWIPLTILAAGMGYLYQRTHRLLPSLVIHALINSSSLLALWVQVYDVKG